MLYTSLENKKIKELKKLQKKKYRDQIGLFLIEGEHLLEEALKKNLVCEIFYLDGFQKEQPAPVHTVTSAIMKELSELETIPNVIALCKKKAETLSGNRILAIDGVQDPGNLGTMIRSAVAFHVDGILLGEDCVDLYNSKTIRATQGMLFHIPIEKGNLQTKMKEYHLNGYHLYATNVEHGKSLKCIEKYEKVCIIMGNEGNGVKQELQALCDELLYIDMNPVCESLNVAIATSIILYELDK